MSFRADLRPHETIVWPSANSVHVIPNNSHRRQIDARTSRASLSSKPINLRQFCERNGRELREVIANLHAGRNLERDTPRFGRGNGKVTTYCSKWNVLKDGIIHAINGINKHRT